MIKDILDECLFSIGPNKNPIYDNVLIFRKF